MAPTDGNLAIKQRHSGGKRSGATTLENILSNTFQTANPLSEDSAEIQIRNRMCFDSRQGGSKKGAPP